MADEPVKLDRVVVDGVEYTPAEYDRIMAMIKAGQTARARNVMRRVIQRNIQAGRVQRPTVVSAHPRRHHFKRGQ